MIGSWSVMRTSRWRSPLGLRGRTDALRHRHQSCRFRVPIFVIIGILQVVLAPGSASGQERDASGRRILPSQEAIAKLPPDGGPLYNRLVFENSPYLLQHAANPVEWYPWGEEAFEKARREEKLIFLSIGYSTCHWCHVMERESFADPAVAALLNADFVCIMVDREERPDIDEVYMAASVASRGSGGWPQSVFMTSDRQPFFLASYIPRQSRQGRIGMLQLIPEMTELWYRDRNVLVRMTSDVLTKLEQHYAGSAGPALGADTLTAAFQQLSERYDPQYGGLGDGPKFPPTHQLSFLLRYWRRTGDARALEMVETTLTAMRRGGIFDQIGFGFHRYATDPAWNVPHFEKMLDDQAMLAMTYVEAYQATGRALYAETAEKIFAYVLREMVSAAGGFFSAEDADSEGSEGRFYVWTVDEVVSLLGEDEGGLFIEAYHLEPDGNYNDQATGEKTGSNVPHLGRRLEELAAARGVSVAALRERLEASRQALFAAREQRIHPAKDDKILTDWTGLMIVALAKGGQVFHDARYTAAAQQAADFVLARMRAQDGRLWHRHRAGDVGLPAHLEDYAFFVWGLLELYEATFDIAYLERAIELNAVMIDDFWDSEGGGFYMTAHDGEALLVRPKNAVDVSRPSGNSVAALNLIRLGRITAEVNLEEKVDALFRAFSQKVNRGPSAFTQLLIALDMAVGPTYEVVIAGYPGADDSQSMLSALRDEFAPNKVILFRPEGEDRPRISEIAEFTAAQHALDGKATAYVCIDYACRLPTTDIREMLASLNAQP